MDYPFWDVTLLVGPEKKPIQAHRHQLLQISIYFQKVLEKHGNTIHLPDCDVEMLLLIFKVFYTGVLSVTIDNCKQLMMEAKKLSVRLVEMKCLEFITNNVVGIHNCVSFLGFANMNDLPELLSFVNEFIHVHQAEFIECAEFLQLTSLELQQLLIYKDYIFETTRQNMLPMISKWVEFDEVERRQYLPHLLRKVGLEKLPLNILGQTYFNKESVVMRYWESATLIMQAMIENPLSNRSGVAGGSNVSKFRFLSSPISVSGSISENSAESTPSRTIKKLTENFPGLTVSTENEADVTLALSSTLVPTKVETSQNFLILCISDNHRLCTFDLETQNFRLINWLPYKHQYAVLVASDSKVYYMGGKLIPPACLLSQWSSDQVQILNMKSRSETQVWHKRAPMLHLRIDFAAVTLNKTIYVMGGWHGSITIRRAEKLTSEGNGVWVEIDHMRRARRNFGAVVMDGKIYVAGGKGTPTQEKFTEEVLDSAEVYDVINDEWTLIPSMNTQRFGMRLTTVNGRLYAIGGSDKNNLVLSSVEEFDPTTNCWSLCAEMIKPRKNMGVAVVDELVYVMGGEGTAARQRSLEIYNPASNNWTMLSTTLPSLANFHSMTVVDKSFDPEVVLTRDF